MTSLKLPKWLFKHVTMSSTDWLVDCVIAAGSFGFGLLMLTLSANLFIPDEFTRRLLGIKGVTPSAAVVFSLVLLNLPLIFRRRISCIVLVLTIAIWEVVSFIFPHASIPIISLLIGVYTVSYDFGKHGAVASAALSLIAIIIPFGREAHSSLDSLLFFQNVALIVAVAFAGYALNARQLVAEAAEIRARDAEALTSLERRRAIEAEHTRESEASRRVEEERVRIAREIHDITAHSLSAVSIQASVAERLLNKNPEEALSAIIEVRNTANHALSQMRAVVGVLRGTDSAEISPTEGIEQINTLVDFIKDAGISCDLYLNEYNASNVPLHIDVALYRIAREACTNIVRHSNATSVSITFDISENSATLKIADNGSGFDVKQVAASSHGLSGMRERARLLGGTFLIESSSLGTAINVSIPIDAITP